MTGLAYAVCALVWGTTWFAIRVCIAPGGYPTVMAAALRFTVAAAVLLPLYLGGAVRPGPRDRRELAWLVLAGLLNTGSYLLVYTAEESIPGGLAAVIFGTYPLVTAILAALTRTERAHPSAVIGALVGLAGIAIIFWDRLDVSLAQAQGVALVLGSVVLSASYNIVFKRHAGSQHPLASTAVFMTVTAAATWVVAAGGGSLHGPWPPPVRPTAALIYLGLVGSVVAFGSYFYLLKRVTLMTASTLVFLEPIIALSVDALWEDSVRLVARTYAGAAVTLAGVVISVALRRRA